MALAASEAATSANLMHDGVVATYYHVIAQPKLQHAPEFKLRLVTVRPCGRHRPLRCPAGVGA